MQNNSIDELVNYFLHTHESPIRKIYEIYDSQNHAQNKNLRSIISNINEEDYLRVDIERNINHFSRKNKEFNVQNERYLAYWMFKLQEIINRKYISTLIELPNLVPIPIKEAGLNIDKQGLVKVSDFEIIEGGLKFNNLVFTMAPFVNYDNSSHWLFEYLCNIGKRIPIRIKLNPYFYIGYESFDPVFYKMYLHGKDLDWDRIFGLKKIEEGAWIPISPTLSHSSRTEFVWTPDENIISFTCEELPKESNLAINGSRYFHAKIDRNTRKIIHCDGAIRIYTESEFKKRTEFPIKSAEVTKIGKRIKFFQIDHPLEITQFSTLATKFFVWNEDVMSYFN